MSFVFKNVYAGPHDLLLLDNTFASHFTWFNILAESARIMTLDIIHYSIIPTLLISKILIGCLEDFILPNR